MGDKINYIIYVQNSCSYMFELQFHECL